MNPQKIGGLVILLFGLPLGMLARDGQLFFAAASIAFLMIYFAKERHNDERVEQLKMKALFLAMSIGLAVTGVGSYYVHAIWSRFQADPGGPYHTVTAYEFISVVLLIALGLFHYWRWQDGREAKA